MASMGKRNVRSNRKQGWSVVTLPCVFRSGVVHFCENQRTFIFELTGATELIHRALPQTSPFFDFQRKSHNPFETNPIMRKVRISSFFRPLICCPTCTTPLTRIKRPTFYFGLSKRAVPLLLVTNSTIIHSSTFQFSLWATLDTQP